MHDLIIVGISLIAILAGILFNRSDVKELRKDIRADMNGFRAEFRSELSAIRGEVNTLRIEIHQEFEQFYLTLGQHEARN